MNTPLIWSINVFTFSSYAFSGSSFFKEQIQHQLLIHYRLYHTNDTFYCNKVIYFLNINYNVKKSRNTKYNQVLHLKLNHLGCRMHQLHPCRVVRPSRNECPAYDTKQSDSEVPVMQELWEMQSTPSFPSLPGPLCPGVVASDRVLSMSKIELTAYKC